MSNQITNAFIEQFSANVTHVAQQKRWTFEGAVTTVSLKGKTSYFNQLGKTAVRRITQRTGVSTPQNTDHIVRSITATPYDAIEWLDEFDDVSTLIDPNSSYVQAQAMAINRAKTQEVIDAATGIAYTGVRGAVATTLPASQIIGVNYVHSGAPANSGLTLSKLIEVKRRLMSADAYDPSDPMYIAVRPKQLADLLNNVAQVSSADYANVKALVNGDVDSFVGLRFLITNLLSLDTLTDYATCFAFCKSGLAYGDQDGPKSYVDILPGQSHTIQIRSTIMCGAARFEESKVVSIICDESV